MPFSCNLNFSVFFKLKNYEENHVPEGRILMTKMRRRRHGKLPKGILQITIKSFFLSIEVFCRTFIIFVD